MRQFRDLSDIVGLRKAGKLDRQNLIQSSRAEFFEITTSVSFHECARGSIYYRYIPRRCFTLRGKGDRSIDLGVVYAWLRGCALSYRSSPVGVTAQLLNTKCNFSSLYVPRYPAPAPVSDHLLRVCGDRIYERISRCLYGDRALSHPSVPTLAIAFLHSA